MLPLLLQQLKIKRVDFVLERLRRLEAGLIFYNSLAITTLGAQSKALDATLHHFVRLEDMRLKRVELWSDFLQPIVEVNHAMQVCNKLLLAGVGHIVTLRVSGLTALSGCHL